MNNDKLKPCPFCGGRAELENDGIRPTRSRDNGDLMTYWKVPCINCGAALPSAVSEYRFGKDELLHTIAQHDGKARVIEKWNGRHEHGKD